MKLIRINFIDYSPEKRKNTKLHPWRRYRYVWWYFKRQKTFHWCYCVFHLEAREYHLRSFSIYKWVMFLKAIRFWNMSAFTLLFHSDDGLYVHDSLNRAHLKSDGMFMWSLTGEFDAGGPWVHLAGERCVQDSSSRLLVESLRCRASSQQRTQLWCAGTEQYDITSSISILTYIGRVYNFIFKKPLYSIIIFI